MNKEDLLKLKKDDVIVIKCIKGTAKLANLSISPGKSVICKLRRPAHEGTTTVQLQCDVVESNCYRYADDLTICIDTCDERQIEITAANTKQIAFFAKVQNAFDAAVELEHTNNAIRVLTIKEHKLSVALKMIGISLPDRYVIRLSELLRFIDVKYDNDKLDNFSLHDAVDLELRADEQCNDRQTY